MEARAAVHCQPSTVGGNEATGAVAITALTAEAKATLTAPAAY